MSIKVAVLEDDIEFRENILVPGLRVFGFDVEGFGKSAELYLRMLSVPFQILVVDLRLEAEDGLEIARHLREISAIGIVTLTGKGTREEHIRGLTEVVDVWLSKPIDIDVLAATLHGLSRRLRSGQNPSAPDLQNPSSRGWRLSPGNWRLIAPDGRSMPLNPLERGLLARLTATAGDLVAHADLLNEMATIANGFDRHRLEIVIHRLRRKVASHFGRDLPLKSVRGSGYLMDLDDQQSSADGKPDESF
jgi:two-component system response regulator PhoP